MSQKRNFAKIAAIYDILGDCDLDHLRELVEADKAGRVCMTHYKPGEEVWIVERFEDGEPDCVSGYVFVGEVCGAVIVHPFIGGCVDLDAIVKDCIDGRNVGYSCDLAMYPAADCYDALGLAEEALAKEVQPNDRN